MDSNTKERGLVQTYLYTLPLVYEEGWGVEQKYDKLRYLM